MDRRTLGAYCYTAAAIVPVPEDGICEWCGSRHMIRYSHTWTGEKWEWQTVNYDPPRYIEKPENYSEDGM